jgi:CHAT domain-containing protein/Tfp pilus assembly protein PilF
MNPLWWVLRACLRLGVASFIALVLVVAPAEVVPAEAQSPPPATPSGERAPSADGLYVAASLLYRQGEFDGALTRFIEAASVAETASDRFWEGNSLYMVGVIQTDFKRYDEAIAAYEEAWRLATELGDIDLEEGSLVGLGLVYTNTGQFEKGLPLLERRLEILREEGDKAGEIDTLVVKAGIHSIVGDTSSAFATYQRALELVREDSPGDGEGVRGGKEGTLLLAMGNAYGAIGQFDIGLGYWLEAHDIFKELGNKEQQRGSISALITAYTYLERYNEAFALERDGLALAEGDPYYEAKMLIAIGSIYSNRGRTDDNAADLEEALGYYARAGEKEPQVQDSEYRSTLRFDVLVSIGSGEIYLERFDPALEHLMAALELVQYGTKFESNLYGNIGLANEKLGRTDEALKFYDLAIAKGEEMRQASRLADYRVQLADLYAGSYGRAVLLRHGLGRDEEAFDFAEKARARTFLDLLANKRLDVSERSDPELVEREQTLRNELRALETSVISQEQIDNKRREYDEVLRQLKLADEPYHALVDTTETLTVRDVQRLLDDETTLLSYLVTPEDTLAFVLTSDTFETLALGIGERELKETIESFRESTKEESPEALRQLHARLVAPVLPHLTTPAVGIIAHGDLHYLPFAALNDGTQLFGDSFRLFQLPSARALPSIRARVEASEGVVLPLSYDLTEGRKEVEAVARRFQVKAYVRSEATETRLKAEVGGAAVLHVASHGEMTAATPLFSRVKLAPDDENNGNLEVHEIYGLDLRGTGLVVLSACQTELGRLNRGDDLIGLTRAFIYAGSPSVIASLWNVNDKATRVFMEHFYGQLQEGRSKAEALQVAQQRTREEYPAPYYWAAFVLTGDPGSIEVKLGSEGGGSLPVRWMAAGAVSVLVLGIGGVIAWGAIRFRRAGASDDAGSGERGP